MENSEEKDIKATKEQLEIPRNYGVDKINIKQEFEVFVQSMLAGELEDIQEKLDNYLKTVPDKARQDNT